MPPHSDAPSPAGSFSSQLYNHSQWHSSNGNHNFISDSSSSASADNRLDDEQHIKRPLTPGVYVPTMCFFDPDTEDVDTAAIAAHAVRLAQAGVTGLATQGSNGEAVHLSHSERQLVTATTRAALNDGGFSHVPVIVGCGSQSTRETVQYCHEAWEAGGDYALVLPPSYYATLFAPASETILEYFTRVADKSPIPIIIYNFPGAVGAWICVKLTCGNTGKLNRVAAATRKPSKYNPKEPEFLVLAGSADFLIPSLAGGGHGILAGLANIAPRACIKTMELYLQGNVSEAQKMQEVVSQGDWTAIQGGVVGVKAGLQAWMGYGGFARSPLPRPDTEQTKRWREGFRDLVMLERSL
ncbi:putative 4-hydroxy-2-oxoglutarate aldolase [Fusarium oxysporum f. sp. raphani]|uniref:Putative 4-hydroxy-2-oxoglutarate aldolase n=1 Tax=Fusarium oxysporum f. sp. raphani TaxID=96318 RepID=A0A8J5Q318_FUSOX|nr:putative 4-hydroxy-2-oxoglutarate aldolase [Fusarium oxysporum f. sp. raphani]